MMMRFTYHYLGRALRLTLLSLAAGSCTVYAPMQPTMPLLRAAGQAEGTASIQPNGRVEITGAVSPARHVLLTAGGTVCPRLGSESFLVSRQYEVGGGAYLPLGDKWLLNGLGGYGQAINNRGYKDLGFLFFAPTYSEYSARYSKVFGQVGIAKMQERYAIGATYRLTQVHFSSLTSVRHGDLPLARMLRHEVLLFVRHTWGYGTRGQWESLVTAGLSGSGTPKLDDSPGAPGYGAAAYDANRNLLPAFMASLGVVYRPRWQRAATAPAP